MSEYLHTVSYEPVTTDEWMKQRSLELMREMSNPDYPAEKLTWGPAVYRDPTTGILQLPATGHWHAPTKHDETVTPEMIAQFRAEGTELDCFGRPVHPWADDMLHANLGTHTGKGFYRTYGGGELETNRNRTADPIIFRHDQSEPMILLVQRDDSGLWGLPGGFINDGESPSKAALREAREETMPDTPEGEAFELFDPVLIPIYQGPVADRRATLHAWPETTAYAVHLNPHKTGILPLAGRGDPHEVAEGGFRWVTLDEARAMPLFGSHALLIDLATRTL